MRELTFAGYLRQYVRSISTRSTNSIFKLAREVPENPRLREPLLLYAFSIGKIDLLLRASSGCPVCSQYAELGKRYTWESLMNALEDMEMQLGWDYIKVYKSYLSRRDKNKTDSDTKTLMHKEIRYLQALKGVSNYRLYTDLCLSPSNANAFLKNGYVNRLNIEAVERMLHYLVINDKEHIGQGKVR